MFKILTALALMLTPVAAVAQSPTTTMVDVVEQRIEMCKTANEAIAQGRKDLVNQYVGTLTEAERTVFLSICYAYLRGKQDERNGRVSQS